MRKLNLQSVPLSTSSTSSPTLLHRLMESSAYNLILLLLSELDKVYCVAGYSDGKLWIFLRMLLCIYKSLPVKYIDIKMMSTFLCVSIQ